MASTDHMPRDEVVADLVSHQKYFVVVKEDDGETMGQKRRARGKGKAKPQGERDGPTPLEHDEDKGTVTPVKSVPDASLSDSELPSGSKDGADSPGPATSHREASRPQADDGMQHVKKALDFQAATNNDAMQSLVQDKLIKVRNKQEQLRAKLNMLRSMQSGVVELKGP